MRMKNMKRREFLTQMIGSLVAMGLPAAQHLYAESGDYFDDSYYDDTPSKQQRVLILLELAGGNDGLNTLIPYSQPEYAKFRPNLAIPESSMIKLDDNVAMHPALKPLEYLWHVNELTWVQGVGYDSPSLSHYRATQIWDTASSIDQAKQQGWVSQYLKNPTR